jgi:hypothetical protein
MGRNFAASFAGFGQRQMDKIKRDLGDMREKNRDELEYGVGGCDLDSFIHFPFLHSFIHFPCNLVLPRIFLLFCLGAFLRLDSLMVARRGSKHFFSPCTLDLSVIILS